MAKGQHLKPEQIITLLRQIDVLTMNDQTLAQACKEVGTVEQSYYRWRKIYGGMKVDQAKKYKDLEVENTRLEKLVADLSLREAMLKEVIKGSLGTWIWGAGGLNLKRYGSHSWLSLKGLPLVVGLEANPESTQFAAMS